jgi:hypothetical protein
LVLLVNTRRGQVGSSPFVSAPRINAWREHSPGIREVTAYLMGPPINLTGVTQPQQVGGGRVSAGFFRLFGAPFAHGRPFTLAEDQPNGPQVAVLSYGLWQRQWAETRASWVSRSPSMPNPSPSSAFSMRVSTPDRYRRSLWHRPISGCRSASTPRRATMRISCSQQRELAIRTAVGASLRRLVRQLVTESVVLCGIGGAVGCALGSLGISVLLHLQVLVIPRIGQLGSSVMELLDTRVLWFALATSLTSGVACGVAPALKVFRDDDGGRDADR